METESEFLAKKIMTVSRLEITQPDLNNSILQKILLAERKKAMNRALLCCFLGLSSLGVVIFLAAVSIQQNDSSLVQIITTVFQKALQLSKENQFIFLPVIVLFILQLFTKRNKKSYHVPDLNF